MQYFLKLLFCSCLIAIISSCTTKVSSVKADRTSILDEDVGYLFLTIDTDISFSKFLISGPSRVQLREPDFYEGKNYYLVAVEAGTYRIQKFHDSFGRYVDFDDDEDGNLWEFEVKPQAISYIGDFKVRTIFGGYSSFILVNNASYALEYLEKKYPKILANRSISYEGPGEDFFFELVSN